MAILRGTSTLSAAGQTALIQKHFSSATKPAKFLPDLAMQWPNSWEGRPSPQARQDLNISWPVWFASSSKTSSRKV